MRRADNPQYQLTRAEYPAGTPFNGAVDQWTYDSIGNRTSANQNGTPLTYQYQQNTNNPQNGQLLNTDGVNTYTYDAAGNMATQTGPSGTYTYQYDAENRLKAILTSGLNAYYTYDYQGRRTSKTVGGVTSTYLYDGLNVVRDTADGVPTLYLFGPGIDEPLALQKLGDVHYLTVDGLGSVVGEADPSGAMAHASIFDVWGVQKTESGTRLSAFGYTGREFGEGGLWFYRARFYQPGVGRFTQEDPAEWSSDLYTYAVDDPVLFGDPTGHQLADLDAGGQKRVVLRREELEKRMSPKSPLPPDVKKQLDNGCVGLCAVYQGLGTEYPMYPEDAPGTRCYSSEAQARSRPCGKGQTNFVFAKQGNWKGQEAPHPDPSGRVPNDSISNYREHYNYVTTFPGTNTYAWMNNGVAPGYPEQLAELRHSCPAIEGYPKSIWCSTCVKSKGGRRAK